MIHRTLAQLCRLFATSASATRKRAGQHNVQTELLEVRQLLAASGLQAFHRSGQTFITWNEDGKVTGEKYNVYRSASPITSANLSTAEKLTSKWGPLDDKTSVHTRVAPGSGVPANFVIQDLGAPLSGEKGLFVCTTPTGKSGAWYYAVTQVTAGVESLTVSSGSSSLSTAVAEVVATPSPVLTVSNASGKGRIYTQYMDYARWNPTFQGYAYNYSVALPDAYDPNVAWPIKLMPHAYGERFRMEQSAEYGWPSIEVFVDDSGGGGAPGMRYQTWWYGFATDHNYLTGGAIPSTGRVENFTEQRVLKAIDEVAANFNVDKLRIHSQGHSMGASGSLSLGMRYADVFSGIFASEPMTNYATSPGFQEDFSVLWGTQTSNLPIVSNGAHAAPLKRYDGLGVYNWMNHDEQLVNRRGEPMAFLMVGHGKADDVIDWATQGRPFIAALNASNVGFTAEQRYGWDHNWMSFNFSLDSMFSPADGGLSAWAYPSNVSFPGISNATGSGPLVPGLTGTDFYNMAFEWSVPWNQFHTNIVDTTTTYEISLRSSTVAQTADVTPQRTQAFRPAIGTTVTWKNVNNATGAIVQSGTTTIDADGLATLRAISIGTGIGNRLILTTEQPVTTLPVLTAPSATSVSMTPLISWEGVSNAVSYDLMVRNISTGLNVVLRQTVTALEYTPTDAMGIGRYRVNVRARSANGVYSAWSAVRDFRITTAPVIEAVPAVVSFSSPVISWNSLPGAVKYELRLNNLTTGVLVQNSIPTNSYQISSNLGLGSYQVLVRGIDAAGLAGQWSTARRFTSASPVQLTPSSAATFNAQPILAWSPLPGAVRYEFVLRDRATKNDISRVSDLTGTTWTPESPLANGDYRWWVRGFTAAGNAGSWSVSQDFTTGGKPTLLNVPATTADRTPTFTWTAVQGAARYEIWIAKADVNVVVLNVINITTNSFTPSSDLLPQGYRVWVRAISTTGTASVWSSSATFTVTDLDSGSPLSPAATELLIAELSWETNSLFNAPANQAPSTEPTAPASSEQEYVVENVGVTASQTSNDHEVDIDRVMTEWLIYR